MDDTNDLQTIEPEDEGGSAPAAEDAGAVTPPEQPVADEPEEAVQAPEAASAPEEAPEAMESPEAPSEEDARGDAEPAAEAAPDEEDEGEAADAGAEEGAAPADDPPEAAVEEGAAPADDALEAAVEEGAAPADDVPEAAVEEDESEPKEQVSMMEMLMEEGDYLPEKYQRGDLVEGRILSKDKDQIVLDIGAKQEGIVPGSDLARLPKEVVDALEVDQTIQTVVMRPEGREGEVLVSINQARTIADWDNATACLDSGEILELDIVGFNKGGALVGFGNLQGFVPKSHLTKLSARSSPEGAQERLAEIVGESIPVKVIEVSRRKRRLIMSERLALREWRSERKQRLLEQLKEGEIRRGSVSSVADFGAFVDLGGADGLVHVSELTYERGKHPRDVVKVGQEVEVYVLSIDRERKRIALSMKRLQNDPWETVEEDHYVGELVEASISNVAKFGAFARLEDGLEGLIHISELSDEHVEHPREAVRPGQRVTVEIISIEPHRQRIGLSIRRVPRHLRTIDEPEPEPEPTHAEVAEAAAVVADELEAEAEVETVVAIALEADAEAKLEAAAELAADAEARLGAAADLEDAADAQLEVAEELEADAEVELEVAEALATDAVVGLEAAAELEADAEAELEVAAALEADAGAELEAAAELEAEVETEGTSGPELEAEAEDLVADAVDELAVAADLEDVAEAELEVAAVIEADAEAELDVAEALAVDAVEELEAAAEIEDVAEVELEIASELEDEAEVELAVAEELAAEAVEELEAAAALEADAAAKLEVAAELEDVAEAELDAAEAEVQEAESAEPEDESTPSDETVE